MQRLSFQYYNLCPKTSQLFLIKRRPRLKQEPILYDLSQGGRLVLPLFFGLFKAVFHHFHTSKRELTPFLQDLMPLPVGFSKHCIKSCRSTEGDHLGVLLDNLPPVLTAAICAILRSQRRELRDIESLIFPSRQSLYRTSASSRGRAAKAVATLSTPREQ